MHCRMEVGLARKSLNKYRVLAVIYPTYKQANVKQKPLFRFLVALAILASLDICAQVMPQSRHFSGFRSQQNLHRPLLVPSQVHLPSSWHILSSGKEVVTRKALVGGIHEGRAIQVYSLTYNRILGCSRGSLGSHFLRKDSGS